MQPICRKQALPANSSLTAPRADKAQTASEGISHARSDDSCPKMAGYEFRLATAKEARNESLDPRLWNQSKEIGPNPQTQRGIARHGKSIENVKVRYEKQGEISHVCNENSFFLL